MVKSHRMVHKGFIHTLTSLNGLPQDLYKLQMPQNVAQLMTNITSLLSGKLQLVECLSCANTLINGLSR